MSVRSRSVGVRVGNCTPSVFVRMVKEVRTCVVPYEKHKQK